MTLPTYGTAQAAFRDAVERVHASGNEVAPIRDTTSVGSQFGRKSRGTRELIADGFILRDPRARIISSAARPFDLTFAIANVVWTLSGNNDLEMIAFYKPQGRSFSNDGFTLAGAVGHRIFASPDGDQASAIVNRLRADPASRRTVLQVLSPSDIIVPPLDTPCSIAFEYLLRDGCLTGITFMRSQSVVGVLPYDLFLFTTIQETLAVALGADLGAYHHISGSLHYYEDEAESVIGVLAEAVHPPVSMPRMSTACMGAANKMALAEAEVRLHLRHDPTAKIDVHSFELDAYWTQILRVLIAGGRRKLGADSTLSELALIDEPYRSALVT
jgi:thymidylate synthase